MLDVRMFKKVMRRVLKDVSYDVTMYTNSTIVKNLDYNSICNLKGSMFIIDVYDKLDITALHIFHKLLIEFKGSFFPRGYMFDIDDITIYVKL